MISHKYQGVSLVRPQGIGRGTSQKMTTISGAVAWSAKYSSFGKATIDPSSTVTNNLRFPGQYYDEETGLHYNWHRYYDPATGRYWKVDPIGLGGGTNLYAYCQNNPIIFIDIMGFATCTFTYGGKGSFTPGKGYKGVLKCECENTKTCDGKNKTVQATAYTGKGDKKRYTTQWGGPIAEGDWKIRNVGWVSKRKKWAYLRPTKKKQIPPGRTDSFFIHPMGEKGSKGCIAVDKDQWDKILECLKNDKDTGGSNNAGTLKVIINQ